MFQFENNSNMFPKLTQFKTTSSEFFAFTKPLHTKDFALEEKMITSFESRTMRRYIDLKPLRDTALSKALKEAIDEIALSYPSYNVFPVKKAAEIYCNGTVPETLPLFRLSVSRNDDTRTIFINIQLKYETPRQVKELLDSRIPVLDISSEMVSLVDEEDIDSSPRVIRRRSD